MQTLVSSYKYRHDTLIVQLTVPCSKVELLKIELRSSVSGGIVHFEHEQVKVSFTKPKTDLCFHVNAGTSHVLLTFLKIDGLKVYTTVQIQAQCGTEQLVKTENEYTGTISKVVRRV